MKSPIKKISTVVIGRTLKEIYNHTIDYVVYPLVLLKLGYWTGLVVMIFVTAAENFGMLLLYTKMRIDWLGYEYVQSVKDWATTKQGLKKFIGKLVRKSDFILFLLLSTLRDSFETTAYFQPDIKSSKAKTGLIFISSVLIGNLYWSLGVELFINSWLRQIIK